MKRIVFLFFVFLLLVFKDLIAIPDELQQKVSFTGKCKILSTDSKKNILNEKESINVKCDIYENDVIYNPPNSIAPLATDSMVLIGSHTLILYPASSIKILKDGFIPLSGRIELNDEDENCHGLKFCSKKYVGEYVYGNLKIEVTPDSGTFFAMFGEGYAWIKNISRKTVELKRNTELYFPLYGESTTSKSLSGFWNDKPSNFGNLR